MVTHNTELAKNYANRIVPLKDGRIIDDSNPFKQNFEKSPQPEHKNLGESAVYFRHIKQPKKTPSQL